MLCCAGYIAIYTAYSNNVMFWLFPNKYTEVYDIYFAHFY